MKRSYLLVCLYGISISFVAACVALEAIVGGEKAIDGEFKFLVSLQKNGKHFCGGGIISQYFVLTAARCIIGKDGLVKDLHNMSILAGTHDLRIRSEPAVTHQICVIYVPTDFNPATPAYLSTANIAILELDKPLPLKGHSHLRALKLPVNKSETFVNSTVTIAGFGWTWINVNDNGDIVGGNNDSRLRWAKANVLSRSHPCYLNQIINVNKIICAEIEQHAYQTRGICAHDRGGPLVRFGYSVIGILSAGPANCSERGHPATYTRITAHMSFIQSVKSYKKNNNVIEYSRVRYVSMRTAD